MPFVKKRNPKVCTLGVFVPCDPRIDDDSRQRAYHIGTMTARFLADRLRLPDGARPNIFFSSNLVDGEQTADAAARELKEAGAEALFIVPDTWFFPGKSAMALTAHFPSATPLACVGGNNAPKAGRRRHRRPGRSLRPDGAPLPDGHRHDARNRTDAPNSTKRPRTRSWTWPMPS